MTAYKNLIPINKLYLIANDSEKIINIQVSTQQGKFKIYKIIINFGIFNGYI